VKRFPNSASITGTASARRANFALPLFAQGVVDLLDVKQLTLELMGLERRTARSGKDSVDHPPQGHDDHANACCGCLALLASAESMQAHMVRIVGF
jgi:hypothetical protein